MPLCLDFLKSKMNDTISFAPLLPLAQIKCKVGYTQFECRSDFVSDAPSYRLDLAHTNTAACALSFQI